MKELAGEPVQATLTAAPGNGQSFGGIKVTAENGWFCRQTLRHRGTSTRSTRKVSRASSICGRFSNRLRPRLRLCLKRHRAG